MNICAHCGAETKHEPRRVYRRKLVFCSHRCEDGLRRAYKKRKRSGLPWWLRADKVLESERPSLTGYLQYY